MPIKLVNGQMPLKERYRMFVINQHNISPGGIPRDGLIGEWLLNGNVNDTSGSGNHGTAYDIIYATDKSGAANSAAEFQTSKNSYIEIGDKYDIGTSDFSLSVWYKLTAVPALGGLISKSIAGAGASRWGLYYTLAGLNYLLTTASTYTGAVNVLNPTTQWHHAVLTFDRDGNLTLYVDNSNVKSSNISSDSAYNIQSAYILRFGSYNSSTGTPGNFIKGYMDNIRFYNKVLTADEITALYNELNV